MKPPVANPRPIAGSHFVDAKTGNTKKFCKNCATLVWDCPPGMLPKYSEDVTCWNCGVGNPRRPIVLYQLWWLKQQWRRCRKALARSRRKITTLGGRI